MLSLKLLYCLPAVPNAEHQSHMIYVALAPLLAQFLRRKETNVQLDLFNLVAQHGTQRCGYCVTRRLHYYTPSPFV